MGDFGFIIISYFGVAGVVTLFNYVLFKAEIVKMKIGY